jgi:hydrogenase maturation protease
MTTRILCLGNSILADDAFGFVVAEQLRRERPDLDVRESSTSGFDLLDFTLGADRLLVIDTMQSGQAGPGSITIFREEDVRPIPGGSPHYMGRALGLPVPADVTIITVEPADCLTVGGPMHRDVAAAVTRVLEMVSERCERETCLKD